MLLLHVHNAFTYWHQAACLNAGCAVLQLSYIVPQPKAYVHIAHTSN